jgi:hypothetical protein
MRYGALDFVSGVLGLLPFASYRSLMLSCFSNVVAILTHAARYLTHGRLSCAFRLH